MTPWDLGYGQFVKFDHDFIGRPALERLADGPHRRKVTLALDNDDALRCIGSQLFEDDRAKYMDFPSAVYSMHPFDKVLVDDEVIGLSTWIGYSSNERRMLALAVVDEAYAEPGTEVNFVWRKRSARVTRPARYAAASAWPTPASTECRRWFAVSMPRKPVRSASSVRAGVRSSFHAVP